MAAFKEFLRSNKGLTFVALVLTLVLGIAIGTIVSDGVMSAEKREQVAELKIQGAGSPLVLDQQLNLSEGFARIASTVGPAVVNISTTSIVKQRSRQRGGRTPDAEPFHEFFGEDFFERFFGPSVPGERKLSSLGSGVIVDSKGYILTNDHVVSTADKISVKLASGDTYIARIVGEDRENDLAVLKIDTVKPLPFAKVGDATGVKVGDWVLAIGSPFGLDQTVTAGIVSATGRIGFTTSSGRGIVPFTPGAFGDYIQTDAAINPGNSGGALVNTRGEIVGINTFISTKSGGSEGVGFAIPSTVFINSYNQLVNKGKIERGWLGVSMNVFDMTEELAHYFGVAGNDPNGIKDGDGVIVTQLIDEKGDSAETGPAFKAGIRPEDVIVKFGGREIESVYDLRSAVANTPPGQTVPVVVVRKGQVMNFKVTLAERTIESRERRPERDSLSFDERDERERPKEIGLEFETLSQQDAERLGLQNENGVRIISVAPGSLADEAGLEPNQIITHVNGSPVRRSQEFYDKIRGMPSGKGVVLRVLSVALDEQQRRQRGVSFTSFVKP
jgi:serine protease Do